MKLSTAQSIPVDIYVLILDCLPLQDLAAFYTAYSTEPKMSQIAKWRCAIRLCQIITKGHVQCIPVVDGERHYYKQFRETPFRQMGLRGGSAPTKPFRPFTQHTRFDRNFCGSYLAAEMRLRASEGAMVNTHYQPIDNTGAPGEVVKVDVKFSLGGEILCLEYDTKGVTLHDAFTARYDSEQQNVTHKTLRHRIPLIKAVVRHIDDDEGATGYAIPLDWMEFVGTEVGVVAAFTEYEHDRRRTATSLYWQGSAVMKEFELSWKLRLLDRCCTAETIALWKTMGEINLVVPDQEPFSSRAEDGELALEGEDEDEEMDY
jgi:hypothetical protein